jgi:hypothetical protein
MTNTEQIKEHMKVVGSDGQHVGTVDKIQGSTIILTKSDPTSGGQHHSIPINLIGSIERDAVRLNLPAEQARQQWQVSDGMSHSR